MLFRSFMLSIPFMFSKAGRQNSRRNAPLESGSRRSEFGKIRVALAGQGEILFCESSGIVRGERERHLVKTNINVGMVMELLGVLGRAVDQRDALQKSPELKGPPNRARPFLLVGDGFQVKADGMSG